MDGFGEFTFGEDTVDTTVYLLDVGGIASGEAFGILDLIGVIEPSGIASAEAFGPMFVGEITIYGPVSKP
jgi:hypothetical protein